MMPAGSTDDFSNLTIEQLNWELCIASLDDAVANLKTCREELEKALKNVGDMRQWYDR